MSKKTREDSKQKKSKKTSSWIKYIFFILLVVITVHFTVYFQTQKMFNTKESVNYSATNYFIHANTISLVWINSINKFQIFDNKSLIMQPFIFLVDYFYKKGEKLVKKGNAEDAVWWYVTYNAIYNFHTPSLRFEKLTKEKRRILQKRLYSNAMRLMQDGVIGVEFGKYKNLSISGYFYFATHNLSDLYDGKGDKKLHNYYSDNAFHKKILELYIAYKNFIETNDIKNLKTKLTIFQPLSTIIYSNCIAETNIVQLNCKDKYVKEYMRLFEYLIDNIYNLSDKNSFYRVYLKKPVIIEKCISRCANYTEKIKQIKNKIKLIEKEQVIETGVRS